VPEIGSIAECAIRFRRRCGADLNGDTRVGVGSSVDRHRGCSRDRRQLIEVQVALETCIMRRFFCGLLRPVAAIVLGCLSEPSVAGFKRSARSGAALRDAEPKWRKRMEEPANRAIERVKTESTDDSVFYGA